MDINDEDLLTLLEYYYANKDNGFNNEDAQEFLKGNIEFSHGLIGHYANNSHGLFESAGIEKYRITDAGIVKMRRLKQSIEKKREERQSLLDTQQSVRDTNQISGDNIKYQRKLFWLTFGVAFIGAIGQWVNWQENHIRNIPSQSITLDTSLQQMKSQQLLLMKRVDSLIIQERHSTTISSLDATIKD